MADEEWSKHIATSCNKADCSVRFPRLLSIQWSNEERIRLHLECNSCLGQFSWTFSMDDQWSKIDEAKEAFAEKNYGEEADDFQEWEDEIE